MHLEVIGMRRNRYLTMDQLQRIALSKRVPCPFRPCSAPVDARCVNTSSTASAGAPLGGLGAHVDRLTAAQDAPPAPGPSVSRPSVLVRELAPA